MAYVTLGIFVFIVLPVLATVWKYRRQLVCTHKGGWYQDEVEATVGKKYIRKQCCRCGHEHVEPKEE